jgi:acetyltransferase-like isoleucine patch superfamily enzyme
MRRVLYVTVAIVVVIVVARVVLTRRGVFLVAPWMRRRSFTTCLGSVHVDVGLKSYVLAAWVSNYNTRVRSQITIGKYCSINSVRFVLNGDTGHNHGLLCSTYHWRSVVRAPDKRARVVVGNDVWIGQDVLVLGGVTIGHGAIVGAGSVVTRDVAPYHIVAGNPAQVVRTRYAPHHIRELLRIRWWDVPGVEDAVPYCAGLGTDEQIRLLKRLVHRRRRQGAVGR